MNLTYNPKTVDIQNTRDFSMFIYLSIYPCIFNLYVSIYIYRYALLLTLIDMIISERTIRPRAIVASQLSIYLSICIYLSVSIYLYISICIYLSFFLYVYGCMCIIW
ncbi:hypothetical protein CSUI_011237 [Cystoisospora suis]|uniref:Transmembrane protein n=1 Tax=Cystoisospora suis TaxID=483139 RepID=A0A2C6KEH6_9APIC|nr:hypothetical protein CSUI_011237 [Cystoisospora suis]